jgi:hypothetical protein
MAALGLELRREMRTAEMSAEDLTRASGVDREIIEAMAVGDGDPEMALATVVRLEAALYIDPGLLLEGVTWVPPRDSRRGHYVVADSVSIPGIDHDAVAASMPKYLDRKCEIATMIRVAASLNARPRDLLRGTAEIVQGPA